MRLFIAVIASLALLTSGVALAAASGVQPGSGLLVGQTQISYGCPGPARVGQPHARSGTPSRTPASGSGRSGRKDNRFRRSSGLSSPTGLAGSPFVSAQATTRSRRSSKPTRQAGRSSPSTSDPDTQPGFWFASSASHEWSDTPPQTR
jgi:hypothetical protein